MLNALVYTKDSCPFCTKAKHLLLSKGATVQESKLGYDLVKEDFISMFPEQKTLPLIFINGEKIGGYNELKEYFSNDTKTFLAE